MEAPKTAKSRRAIPLSKSVVASLRDHRRRQAEERLRAGSEYADHGFIFATPTGGPLDLRNLTARHYKHILKRAGLPDMRLYDLRHSAATLLLAMKVDVKIVAERLGHSTTKLTHDTYSHVIEGMQRQASDALEEALFAPRLAADAQGHR